VGVEVVGKRAEYDPADHPVRQWTGEQERVWRQETSRRFHDLMDKAMMVSYHKYGPVAEGYPDRVNAIETLRLRLAKYEETGNAEHLVDLANFAMIEFMHPSRVAVLTLTDADGSPGRIAANTAIYDTPNQFRNRDLADKDEKPF
jgi:hypothetical protein